MNKAKPSFLPNKPLTSMKPYGQSDAKVQGIKIKDQRNSSSFQRRAADSDGENLHQATQIMIAQSQKKQSNGASSESCLLESGVMQQQQHHSKGAEVVTSSAAGRSSHLHGWVQNSSSYSEPSNDDTEQSTPHFHRAFLPPRLQGGALRNTTDQQFYGYTAAEDSTYEKGRENSDMQQSFTLSGLTNSPLSFASVNLHNTTNSAASSYVSSSTSASKQMSSIYLSDQHQLIPHTTTFGPLHPSPLTMKNALSPTSSSNGDLSVPLMLAKTSTSSWVTTCPSTSLGSAAQLANLGVGIGPGINPNVSATGNSTGAGSTTVKNNPPIVNTGNNGPMCVQPGDWVCSSCGFVNWRRRRVCMRCFPFADTNEMSNSIANGALLAAQLAAGIEPSHEVLSSLSQPKRSKTEVPSSKGASSNSTTSFFSVAVPSLPPRPYHRPTNPDLTQHRIKSTTSEQNFDDRDELEDIMNRNLSLREGSQHSCSPYINSHQTCGFTPSMTETATPHITRSPSMPVLHPSSTSSTAGRSIWTGIPNYTTSLTSQPMTMSTASTVVAPSTSAYRSYHPTTIFASDGDFQHTSSSSLLATNSASDVWQSSIYNRSSQYCTTSGLYSSSMQPHDNLLNDDFWQTHSPQTAYSASSSSSTITMNGQLASNTPTLPEHHHKEPSNQTNDASISSPRLCKSKAVIQPRRAATMSSSSSSIDNQQNRHLHEIPSILLSMNSHSTNRLDGNSLQFNSSK